MPRGRIACAGLSLALLGVAGCSDDPAPADDPPGTPTDSRSAGALSVEVGGGPVGLAVAPDGRVWVALAADNTVVALTPEDAGSIGDPIGYVVGEPIPIGGLPLRLRADGSGVWVSLFDRGQVVRVDPNDGVVADPILVGTEPEGLALIGDTLWIVDQAADAVTQLATPTGITRGSATVGEGPGWSHRPATGWSSARTGPEPSPPFQRTCRSAPANRSASALKAWSSTPPTGSSSLAPTPMSWSPST